MLKPTIPMLVLAAAVVAGCGSEPAQNAPGTAADSVPAPPTISLADLEGTWSMRYTPVSGSPPLEISQVQVTAKEWTLLLPERDPVAAEVTAAGDSLLVVEGPYESIRRPGRMVTMNSVYRLDGDRLVGVVAARYDTGGGDRVVMLSEGSRAP